ncbi:MAG: hypothetical protein FJ143_08430, partial [Deltaproteobacteria bacterium]|nr:hypothetical protein [Deltaproteobacteria bacterium]
MDRWVRRALVGALSTILLLALLIVGLGLFLRSERFQDWLRAELATRTGAAVQFTDLRFRWPFGVTAGNVAVAKPGFSLHSERLSLLLNPAEVMANRIHQLILEKPVLRLDLEEFMKSSAQGEITTAIRQLNVRDGTVVLEIAEGNAIELPQITLDAENLNLGPQSGITLKTDVPALASEAEVALSGSLRELTVKVHLRAKTTRKFFDRRKASEAAPGSLRINALIHAPEKQAPWVSFTAQASELALGTKKVTGHLESRLDFDAKAKEIGFTAQGQLVGFPNVLSPRALPLRDGPAQFTASGRYASNDRSLAIQSLKLTSQLGSGEADGRLILHDKIIVQEARTTLRGLSWEALKPLLPAPLNRWSYKGLGEADLMLRGPAEALDIKGVARSAALSVEAGEFSLGPVELNAPLEASASAVQLKDIRLQGKALAWKAARRSLAAEQIAISGTLAGKAQSPVTFDGRVQLRGTSGQTSDGTSASAGQVIIDGKLAYPANESLRIEGQLQLANAKFAAADSARVGENLALNGSFSAAMNPAKNLISIGSKLNIDGGEVLWGKFFGDLKTQKPVLEFDGDYSFGNDRLDCRRCELAIARVGHIQLRGSVERLTERPQLNAELRSDAFLPGGFFDVFLRDTFKQRYPLLDKIIVGGEMALQTRLQGSLDAFNIAGELSLRNGQLRARSNDWQIGPIALALPFQTRYPESAASSSSEVQPGTIAIQSARFGARSLAPIRTSLSLSNNRLRFHQPIVLT